MPMSDNTSAGERAQPRQAGVDQESRSQEEMRVAECFSEDIHGSEATQSK